VQAVGAAMIVPTSLSPLYPSFPGRQHTLVVGIWAGGAGIAASAGPPVGGLLVTVDWRWIFLINLPIGSRPSPPAPACCRKFARRPARGCPMRPPGWQCCSA
jgi:MFS family permease